MTLLLVLVAALAASSGSEPLVFERATEGNEQAFSMLIPKGWKVEGGIFRVDPTAAGGAAQSIEAKVDFSVKRDEAGTVMLRRLPDWYYCDMRHSPAAQMGMFPTGSNYGGMTVSPVMSASQFIKQVVVPQAHPRARGVKVVAERTLPELVAHHQRRAAAMALPMDFRFDAAIVTLDYEEEGVAYRERVFTLIEDRGVMAAGQWVNRETTFIRAPAEEFDAWEATFSLMFASVKLSPEWIAGEVRGILTRAGTLQRVQHQIQEIDRQITEHRQKTNAEIHNDMFLTLTGQEEYINPYTKETEVGTSELGRFRWQNESGDVIYSDDEHLEPNVRSILNRTDWKRSEVRPRFPH